MSCPDEIANILSRLIELGILRIRAYSGDPTRCLAEADHIHNLPGLILDYSPTRLDYYWQVERPSFVAQASKFDRTGFESLWEELRAHVEPREIANAS